MSGHLVECVPNFSEGRDSIVIAAIRAALESVPQVRVLDAQSDPSHNRSVFTFVTPPEHAVEAAFRCMRVAVERIDLRTHTGAHPRMGATDVVPFVPLEEGGTTMDDCVRLARQLGERVGKELEIPVFLYAAAATRPERASLPAIRKGEFEGLRERIGTDPAADPDFGPRRIHPSAGATAIGARPFLVAFNVYLETPDVSIAKAIAKTIRTSSGGLPAVQASGFDVQGVAQVSMNLLDLNQTSPATVFDAVSREAARHGTRVRRSEIVGLIPQRALFDAAAAYLHVPDATAHVLETKIRAHSDAGRAPTLDSWLESLAARTPTPGGGSAAALAGAMAAALVVMVARLTVGRTAYADVSDRAAAIAADAELIRQAMRVLVEQDAAAYNEVTAAYAVPKGDPSRAPRIDRALLRAAEPPLMLARGAARLVALAQEITVIGNKNARSDGRVASALARAALFGAIENVRANVEALSDPEAGQALLREMLELEAEIGP
ncbi:MAG TPA: glutamate formimidoyltransferase [Gemmatimonadales bacterium]|nr:glutamate formimidoyltransferase [Gemmatimonadales bacterium]